MFVCQNRFQYGGHFSYSTSKTLSINGNCHPVAVSIIGDVVQSMNRHKTTESNTSLSGNMIAPVNQHTHTHTHTHTDRNENSLAQTDTRTYTHRQTHTHAHRPRRKYNLTQDRHICMHTDHRENINSHRGHPHTHAHRPQGKPHTDRHIRIGEKIIHNAR